MKEEFKKLERLIKLLPKDLLNALGSIYKKNSELVAKNAELIVENKELKKQLSICKNDHGKKTTHLNG